MKLDKIKSEIHKKFIKMDMPYYKKSRVRFAPFSEWQMIYLDFILPYNSFTSIFNFCKKNNFGIAFEDGKIEICLYDIKKIRRIKGLVPSEVRTK